MVRVALLLLAASVVPAAADVVLYYGGDANFVTDNILANEHNTTTTDARVYGDFIVPNGQSWNVSALFTSDVATFTATTAIWEIRSGMSEGNGGTQLFSGTSPVTQTPTGRTESGHPELTSQVAVNFTLGPGTYWMAVVPVGNGTGRSWESATAARTNGVGNTIVNDSFFISSYFGSPNYTNANNVGSQNYPNFSDGVIGTVPEPSGVGLGVGMLGLTLAVLRKRLA